MRSKAHRSRAIHVATTLVSILVQSLKLGDGLAQKALLLYVLLRWKLIASVGWGGALPSPKKIDLRFHDTKLPVFVPDDIAFVLVLYEVFVREDYKIDLPHEPTCILDVGANCGLTSLYFAASYPAAIIHALEPSTQNFEFLTRNTRRFPNIHPHRLGLFSRTGRAQLHVHESGARNSLVDGSGVTEEVELMTLDEFMLAHQIAHVDLMKLDVEGAEEDILAASRSIDRIDFIVGELHLKMIRKERLIACLDPFFVSTCESNGSDFEIIEARNRRLIERSS